MRMWTVRRKVVIKVAIKVKWQITLQVSPPPPHSPGVFIRAALYCAVINVINSVHLMDNQPLGSEYRKAKKKNHLP